MIDNIRERLIMRIDNEEKKDESVGLNHRSSEEEMNEEVGCRRKWMEGCNMKQQL
jgi:hypothetical protein